VSGGEPAFAAVLFDIDGTLIDTGGASDRAWQQAFAELDGIEIDVARHTGRGVPDPAVGRKCFRDSFGRDPEPVELETLIERRLAHLREEVDRSPGYAVMPAVVELLERLLAEGTLLGLTTGNVEPAAQIKLGRARLNRFFSFGGFGSDSADRTELTRIALERASETAGRPLDRDRCVSAGDTPRDVEAGHGAGLRVIGVATGEYGVEELAAAGADAAIPSLAEWPAQPPAPAEAEAR
jgi:phosphoglycolate phosphatase